jgi:methoxymalonate biosynthesis acyl carrier protein
MDIEKDITEFVSKTCRIPASELESDTKLYDSAIVSSLRLIELLSHVESTFGITVRAEELVEDNFRDIGTLASFVRTRIGDRARETA